MMIERIRREHGYMVRLLGLLRQKLNQLQAEQSINYSLVAEIVTYLSQHSERVHHPKEDLLYHYYQAHYGQHRIMTNLEREHHQLATQTAQFAELMEMILHDAVVPQGLFIDQLTQFIEAQRQHLEMEERLVLPLIVEQFTNEDWLQVEKEWHVSEDDPVFGATIADGYKQLAERVRDSELECV
ncbi:cation-binding protein [Vibrio sp. SM6]|uniref:Cation-binding protein n=1 Tax=Vibrio agarilyticus TaxID=2726741 RepID=A0A7X8YGD1_9VIBR|nr:hemerythrin domain-containing protein [Vibrio agarilyticus]NLS12262.1 cation-binding protein [Vibrio agarilyticus]